MDEFDMGDDYRWEKKGFFAERKVSRVAWLMFALELVGNAVAILVFFAPGWLWAWEIGGDLWTGEYISHYGLWHVCTRPQASANLGERCIFFSQLQGIPVWWSVCQGLAGATLLFGVITFIILCLYICRKTLNRKIKCVSWVIPCAFIAGFAMIGLFMVFCLAFVLMSGDHFLGNGYQFRRYHFDYAFGLSVPAAIFHLLVGMFACCEVYRLHQ